MPQCNTIDNDKTPEDRVHGFRHFELFRYRLPTA